jgi:hypothetical protein
MSNAAKLLELLRTSESTLDTAWDKLQRLTMRHAQLTSRMLMLMEKVDRGLGRMHDLTQGGPRPRPFQAETELLSRMQRMLRVVGGAGGLAGRFEELEVLEREKVGALAHVDEGGEGVSMTPSDGSSAFVTVATRTLQRHQRIVGALVDTVKRDRRHVGVVGRELARWKRGDREPRRRHRE